MDNCYSELHVIRFMNNVPNFILDQHNQIIESKLLIIAMESFSPNDPFVYVINPQSIDAEVLTGEQGGFFRPPYEETVKLDIEAKLRIEVKMFIPLDEPKAIFLDERAINMLQIDYLTRPYASYFSHALRDPSFIVHEQTVVTPTQ